MMILCIQQLKECGKIVKMFLYRMKLFILFYECQTRKIAHIRTDFSSFLCK